MTEQEQQQVLVNTLVQQRDQAMNGLAQASVQIAVLQAQIAELEAPVEKTVTKKAPK